MRMSDTSLCVVHVSHNIMASETASVRYLVPSRPPLPTDANKSVRLHLHRLAHANAVSYIFFNLYAYPAPVTLTKVILT